MSYRDAMREAKRQYWIALLDRCAWNITHAAREAKVNRQAVHRIMRQHQITRVVSVRRIGRWQEFGL